MEQKMKAMRYAKKAKENEKKYQTLLFLMRTKNSNQMTILDVSSSDEEECPIESPKKNCLRDHINGEFEKTVKKEMTERHVAQLLYQISPTAFRYVRTLLKLPSESTIKKDINNNIRYRMDQLTNINYVSSIISDWRFQNNLKSNIHVPCVLSVNAIAFDPMVELTNKRLIGIDISEELIDDVQDFYHECIKNQSKWKEFIQTYWKNIQNYAFVFYLQPLNPSLKSVVVHFHMSKKGKATSIEKQLLLDIHDILYRYKINTPFVAFDGDTTYDSLHLKFFNFYFNHVIARLNIGNKGPCLMTICDPLHMLKRARYRLLNNRIVCNFKSNASPINIVLLKEILDLPSIIFNNGKITKMHDTLPLMLFDAQSLMKLLKTTPLPIHEISYFIPWTFLLLGIQEESIEREQRIEYLEISFYYVLFYYNALKEYQLPKGLSMKKSKKSNIAHNSNNVTMFYEMSAIQFCNTVKSIITILKENTSIDVSLNRAGSNPLEHLFGKLRVNSHYRNTITNALKNIARDQVINTLKDLIPIRRLKNFGATVFAKNSEEKEKESLFCYSPIEIAVYLLHSIDIEHPVIDDIAKSIDFSKFKVYERIKDNLASVIEARETRRKKKFQKFTTHEITLGVGTGLRGKELTQAKCKMECAINSNKNDYKEKTMDSSKQMYIESCIGKNPTFQDLKSVVAEVSNLYQIKIQKGSLKNKIDALHWIENHWDLAKGVLSSMLELRCHQQ